MGGGIGITPMIAMAHRLHAKDADFELHYSCSARQHAGFLKDLATMPWSHRVSLHFSDEGSRADLDELLGDYRPGYHLYTCGPDRYMTSVMDAGARNGWLEESLHLEYFSLPELPEYENYDFTLKLKKSGREVKVLADQAPTDALLAAGIHIDVKCSDGICGVCKCDIVSGEVEHRDFVLSKSQREGSIILCQSRAAQEDGVVEIDL